MSKERGSKTKYNWKKKLTRKEEEEVKKFMAHPINAPQTIKFQYAILRELGWTEEMCDRLEKELRKMWGFTPKQTSRTKESLEHSPSL